MVRVVNRTIFTGLLNGSLDIDAATLGPTAPLRVHHHLATRISNDLNTECLSTRLHHGPSIKAVKII